MAGKWKYDRTMLIWGLAFGIAATLSGMFILGAVEGGVLAESFFLLVVFWIVLVVMARKLVNRLRYGPRKDDGL